MPDIVTGKVFVDGEKGITATKLNQIQSLAVIQPDFVATKPLASSVATTDQVLILQAANTYARTPISTISSSVAGSLPVADATQNGMMRQVSGNTTDVVDGTNHCVPIASMSGITQLRMRSYNAIGNPTFEVDQRTVGAGALNTGGWLQDRWLFAKTGSMTFSVLGQQDASASPVLVPGTSFAISRNFLRFTLQTPQATLGAGDSVSFWQRIEGPRLRELISDVHSLSLVVRSSVAGLSFGVSLQDATAVRSLTSLVTIPTANVWTLVPLPNLPVWPSGVTWNLKPGNVGYVFTVTLAAGSNFITPTNGAWVTGNLNGAAGQSNFAANVAGSTFDLGFVQHEPGAQCTVPMDKSFEDNLDECLRYCQKSYPYGTAVGTFPSASYAMGRSIVAGTASTSLIVGHPFKRIMVKAPTVTGYHPSTGAVNSMYGWFASSGTIPNATGPLVINSIAASDKEICYVNSGGAASSELVGIFEWLADTGF